MAQDSGALQIQAAEVTYVHYKDDQPDAVNFIRCRLLHSALTSTISESEDANKNTVEARPLNSNIRFTPIKGEVVLLLSAPTSTTTGNAKTEGYYYFSTVSIHGSTHQNGSPGMTSLLVKASKDNSGKYNDAQAGNTTKPNSNELKIGYNFGEKTNIMQLQPYEGDVIYEGRWGHSIRFGSTIDKGLDRYSTSPFWKEGGSGSPILVLRNGQKSNLPSGYNRFINEDINNDAASIYLTDGQSVPLAPSSENLKAAKNKKIATYKDDKIAGKQIIAAAERIILNSRVKEIALLSSGGIMLSSPKSVTLDSGEDIALASAKKIFLGVDADEPVPLGNKLKDLLGKILDLIGDMNQSITSITVSTAVGPSSVPVNSAEFVKYKTADVTKLKSDLEKILSEYAFVKKKSDSGSASVTEGQEESFSGLSPEEEAAAEEYDNNVVTDEYETEPQQDERNEIADENAEEEEEEQTTEDPAEQTTENAIVGNTVIHMALKLNPPQLGKINSEHSNVWQRHGPIHKIVAESEGCKRKGSDAPTIKSYPTWGAIPFCAAGVSYLTREAIKANGAESTPAGMSVSGKGSPNPAEPGNYRLYSLSSHICTWWGSKWTKNNTLSAGSNDPSARAIQFVQGTDYTTKGFTAVGSQKIKRILGATGAIFNWFKDASSGHIGIVVDISQSGDSITGFYTLEFNTSLPGGTGDQRNGGMVAFRYRSFSYLFTQPKWTVTDMTGIPGYNYNAGFGSKNILVNIQDSKGQNVDFSSNNSTGLYKDKGLPKSTIA